LNDLHGAHAQPAASRIPHPASRIPHPASRIPHPASILRENVLPKLGLTVTEAARQLGISRVQLSRVLNERAAISVDLALRLEQWIKGPSAESWLKMQLDHDL
jgi:addiction module HigA family antidote